MITPTPDSKNTAAPEWLSKLGLKNGEFYFDSKPRATRAMRSTCFSRAARVHICLGMHSMGFRQELAVKMEAGKRVPLTPSDIAAETGLHKQHVRPALEELKRAGLADTKGLTKGRVEIYSWAVPRCPLGGLVTETAVPRPVQKPQNGNARSYHFADLPESIKPISPYIKRCRIRIKPELLQSPEYLAAVEAASAEYLRAEQHLRQVLAGEKAPPAAENGNCAQGEMVTARTENGNCAHAPINKVERKKELQEGGEREPLNNPTRAREEALSPLPAEIKTEDRALCIPEPLPDLFPTFWECFVRAGIPLNDTDKRMSRALFDREPRDVQERIGIWVIQQLQNHWRTPEWTANPVNALRSRGWERVALPRTVPKPETRGDRLVRHIIERRKRQGKPIC